MTAANHPSIAVARPMLSDEEKAAVMAVLDSGQLAQGPKTAEFEAAFAAYIGAAQAIGVNSGTAALIVALQANGVGAGDEVITTPFSFIATATSIVACGATPVFVDVDPFDLNIDPELIEDAITERTKAVMPVHLYGHPARVAEIEEICQEFDLALIEDAAQAHGAEHGGRRVGTFGTGCFSFYPTKNMMTGEGGIITSNDAEIARKCRLIRAHGQEERYVHEEFGLNWRMQDMNAAIGLVQLRHLEGWNEARIANARAAVVVNPRGGDAEGAGGRPARVPPVHSSGGEGPGRAAEATRGGGRGHGHPLSDSNPRAAGDAKAGFRRGHVPRCGSGGAECALAAGASDAWAGGRGVHRRLCEPAGLMAALLVRSRDAGYARIR